MTVHDLKVHPEFWPSIVAGTKPFEVRLNDRKFVVGDIVNLREYDPDFGYTNYARSCPFLITFVLAHEDFPNGVPIGYVVLGFGAQ